MDNDVVTSVTWEGFEHAHEEKSADWYWMMSIATITLLVVVIILGNLLLGLLIGIAGAVTMLSAYKGVAVIPYAITTRGVRIDNKLYPYSTLESYFIVEEDEENPLLLVKSQRLLMPLMVIPLPDEYLDEVEELIASRLPEEPMEEPIIHKLMELVGM